MTLPEWQGFFVASALLMGGIYYALTLSRPVLVECRARRRRVVAQALERVCQQLGSEELTEEVVAEGFNKLRQEARKEGVEISHRLRGKEWLRCRMLDSLAFGLRTCFGILTLSVVVYLVKAPLTREYPWLEPVIAGTWLVVVFLGFLSSGGLVVLSRDHQSDSWDLLL